VRTLQNPRRDRRSSSFDDNPALNRERVLELIDDDRMMITLSWQPDVRGIRLVAHVPFAFIKTVLVDPRGKWCIFVEGKVFDDPSRPQSPQFFPTR